MTMSPMIVNQTQFTFSQCVWEAGSGDGGGGGGGGGGAQATCSEIFSCISR